MEPNFRFPNLKKRKEKSQEKTQLSSSSTPLVQEKVIKQIVKYGLLQWGLSVCLNELLN